MDRQIEIDDTRGIVYWRDDGICQACGASVPWPGQLAHKISQSEDNIRRYGAKVIYHPENMELACSGECNDALSIENKPREVLRLLSHIYRMIRREEEN